MNSRRVLKMALELLMYRSIDNGSLANHIRFDIPMR